MRGFILPLRVGRWCWVVIKGWLSSDAPDPGKKGVLIVLPGDFFRIHWKWYYIAMTKIASRKKNKFTRNSVQSKFTL